MSESRDANRHDAGRHGRPDRPREAGDRVADPFADRPDLPVPLAVAREDGAALTCGACGCRLVARPRRATAAAPGDAAWRHFVGPPGRDARGCTVACVDLPHRMASLPIPA
ncbi:MAG TPA: hypothetical protein VF763_09520 [Candidatus Limnocylindrales bacterium]